MDKVRQIRTLLEALDILVEEKKITTYNVIINMSKDLVEVNAYITPIKTIDKIEFNCIITDKDNYEFILKENQ